MASQKLILKSGVSKEEIKKLPATTGIYIFRHKKEYLYIGKSVNIKARVLSHLENAKIDNKEASIIEGSSEIECIITDSEFNALLLESQLIQKHLPKFNSRWRDDKSNLYIKITVKDEYPKVFAARKEPETGARYFGPFQSVYSVELLLKELRRIFPFCMQEKIGKRACFYSKIRLCDPCPSDIVKVDSEQRRNELKSIYLKNIKSIMKILNGNTKLILDDLYKELKKLAKEQRYEEAVVVRNKIMMFEGLLHRKLFSPDAIINYNRASESVQILIKYLRHYFPDLNELRRIECFDVSNFNHKEATASLVVYSDGLIDRSQYRRFRIRNLLLKSDFEMMEEVLIRRFKRNWQKPDLLVVDGGKPQVRIAQQVFSKLNISIPLVGIAKHPDRLVIAVQDLPTVRPPIHNLGFSLIRAIRDESHRFAKKYHVLLRRKAFIV